MRDGLWIVLEKGNEIAHRSQAEPNDDWVLCDVNKFVNLSCLKAPFKANETVAGLYFPCILVGEGPACSWNHDAVADWTVPYCKGVLLRGGVGHGIALAADLLKDHVRQMPFRFACCGSPI